MNNNELVKYLHRSKFPEIDYREGYFDEIDSHSSVYDLAKKVSDCGYKIALVPQNSHMKPYDFTYWPDKREWREADDAGHARVSPAVNLWNRVIEKDDGIKCSPKTALIRLGIENHIPEEFGMDDEEFERTFVKKNDLAIRDICDFAEALGYMLILVRNDTEVREGEFELSNRPLGEDTASRSSFERLASEVNIVGGATIDTAIQVIIKMMDINRCDLAKASSLLPPQVAWVLRGGVRHNFTLIEDALVALGYKLMLVPDGHRDVPSGMIWINYTVSDMQATGTLDGVTGVEDYWY